MQTELYCPRYNENYVEPMCDRWLMGRCTLIMDLSVNIKCHLPQQIITLSPRKTLLTKTSKAQLKSAATSRTTQQSNKCFHASLLIDVAGNYTS